MISSHIVNKNKKKIIFQGKGKNTTRTLLWCQPSCMINHDTTNCASYQPNQKKNDDSLFWNCQEYYAIKVKM